MVEIMSKLFLFSIISCFLLVFSLIHLSGLFLVNSSIVISSFRQSSCKNLSIINLYVCVVSLKGDLYVCSCRV